MIGSSRYIKARYVGTSRKSLIDEIEKLKAGKRALEKRICEQRRAYRRVIEPIRQICHGRSAGVISSTTGLSFPGGSFPVRELEPGSRCQQNGAASRICFSEPPGADDAYWGA
jgi:hypothetical protein